MSPAATAYLGRIPDDRQYMVAAGGMRGNKTQSCAESFNNSNSKARLRHLYCALKQLVVDDRRRFYQRKQWANAERDNLDEATGLHPSMQKLLVPRIERAHELASITFPDPSDKTKAVVRSATHLDKEYDTDITAKTCECGMPVIEKGPCKHLIFHAKSIGKPLSWLLGSKDSLEGYEAQYPADLEYLVPTDGSRGDLAIREPDRQQRAPSPGGEAQSWAPCCEEEEVCYREVWGDEAGQGHVLKVRQRRAHLAQMPRDEGIWGNHRRRGGRKWVNPSQRARAWHGWRARGTEGHRARAALRALCAHRAGAPRAAPLPRARDEVHCVHGALHSAHAHAHRVCRVG